MEQRSKTLLVLLGVGVVTAGLAVAASSANAKSKKKGALPADVETDEITVEDPQGNVTEVAADEVAPAPVGTPSAPVVGVPGSYPSNAPVSTPSAPSVPVNTNTSASAPVSTPSAPVSVPVSSTVPAPAGMTPTVPEEHPAVLETSPALDPIGTVSLARLMLEAETKPNWKTALGSEILAWQKRTETLAPDSKFGPASAYRMAQEVGVLPYIRFWPLGAAWGSGDKNKALAKYRAELNAIADTLAKDPKKRPQADALRASAKRENLQGWPDKPAAAPRSAAEVQSIVDQLGAQAADAAIQNVLGKVK